MIRCWLVLLLLSGCAMQPPSPPRPVQLDAAPFAMNGRISVKHNGSRDSAGLRWTHQAQTDEILLLTPLGQTAARIYRDAKEATLDEGDKHYSDTDVESLMMQVLGWRLQLDGLHHWVLGLTAAGDALVERDESGRMTVLHQDGWEVRYLKYADDKADSLPARMQLSRENLQLTLLIDEWEWNPK
ncbi:MAG: lipoprotein insertase outer membrane protein LolB [Gallionella sp.]|nr:lipoprotein insertase outer membrane protein LolB [Gallionella sp.]